MKFTSTLTNLFMFIPFLMVSLSLSATGNEKASRSSVTTSNDNPVINAKNSSAPGVIFYDNMDSANDTTSLMARGYHVYYRGSGPAGTVAIWYTGSPAVFNAYSGPDTGYVASNYNSVTGNNRIDNWLVLPDMDITAGDTLSFMARSTTGNYPDSLKIMYSATGATLPEDPSWVMLDNINVIKGSWNNYEFYAPTAGTNARFAIRYYLESGGPLGQHSDYIGIDDIMVTGASAVGINEISDANFSISPNPAVNQVTIKLTNINSQEIDLKILNVLGQQVKSEKLKVSGSEMNSTVDISNLPKGQYLVMVGSNTARLTKKLIIE